MPNIIDILARAQSLMNETALNSITPPRAGGIMYDTLLVLNQMQLEGASLLISKVYVSVSAMEADTTPTSDLTGRALKPGQLVVIVTSDTSSSDMGSEYRYNGPGSWTYVGKVGGLPLDTVPTENSTKGITSGGVYAAQAAIEEDVEQKLEKASYYEDTPLPLPWHGGTSNSKYVWLSNGTEYDLSNNASAAKFATAKINVSSFIGKNVLIYASSGSSNYHLFTDENDVVLDYWSTVGSDPIRVKTVPPSAKNLLVTNSFSPTGIANPSVRVLGDNRKGLSDLLYPEAKREVLNTAITLSNNGGNVANNVYVTKCYIPKGLYYVECESSVVRTTILMPNLYAAPDSGDTISGNRGVTVSRIQIGATLASGIMEIVNGGFLGLYTNGQSSGTITFRIYSYDFYFAKYGHPKTDVFVVAADAPIWQKRDADYICDGVNDELTIQQAIDDLAGTGGRVRLSQGTFLIDSFPKDRKAKDNGLYTDSESGDNHRYSAIMLPQNGMSYIIEGDSFRLRDGSGTQIRVSDSCYMGLGNNDLRVILSARYTEGGIDQINNNVSLTMRNVTFAIPWNQKPIMCIDVMFIAKVYLQFIQCRGYISGSVPSGGTVVDLTTPCPKAVQHCVGIRFTGGSNAGTVNDYKNIGVSGFYEGFKIGGEHVVGINLSAILCVYGYTFGNYTYTHADLHPITLINCCDERCYNGPYFALNSGAQQVDLLGWNMEIGDPYITGGEGRGVNATEKVPGTWRGRCEYTITAGGSPGKTWINDVQCPFWEPGNGHGFLSRNMAHLPACSTVERNNYAPDYLERIYDTTLEKEVICVDVTNKIWKDAEGNIV